MEPDYNLETQLRSPANNGDNVNCHPCGSRGRRLFPQRRSSIPISESRRVNANPGFPPLETSPSRDQSPLDQQDHDSNSSSPRSVESVATVEVRTSCTPDRPFARTYPRIEEDVRDPMPYLAGSLPTTCSVERQMTTHNLSNKSLETSFSAPLYTDTPARGNLQWKSMAQFHESGRRLRPRTCQSPEITARAGLVPVEIHQDSDREEDKYIINKDKSRPDVPALEINSWDCTVTLSTVATVTENGRLHVHHLAVLSVIMPMEELYAEKVSLSIVVANALRNDQKCSLGPGQSSLLFKEDISKPGIFPHEGAELIIVRNICDLEKPLNLYFAFTYPSPRHFFMASLPTFRPRGRRSLSEVVFIAEPLPPLSMKTFIRDPFSSWKLCHHPASQVTCYERIDLPRLYPTGFQDDIQMRILELDPVLFRALGGSTLSSVVWKLDITVHELPGEQLECRMSFFLDVGAATALVSLVPHGWVPRYFVVDGRVATEKAGECWKNKEGHITIFKQAHMALGPIMVETYWQRRPKKDKMGDYSTDDSPLPRVADRKMLGGRLACGANEIVLLNHLEEQVRTHGPADEAYILLPTMDAGYRILLRLGTRARSPRFTFDRPPVLPIPKNIQLFENTFLHLDPETKMGHERRGLSPNVKGEAARPKSLLEALLVPLFVLLLLVPGSLLFVEYVRDGNNDNGLTGWRDQYPCTTRRGEERRPAVIEVAGFDALQPDVVGTDNFLEAAKCQGWRDWVDYGSGWRGCVP